MSVNSTSARNGAVVGAMIWLWESCPVRLAPTLSMLVGVNGGRLDAQRLDVVGLNFEISAESALTRVVRKFQVKRARGQLFDPKRLCVEGGIGDVNREFGLGMQEIVEVDAEPRGDAYGIVPDGEVNPGGRFDEIPLVGGDAGRLCVDGRQLKFLHAHEGFVEFVDEGIGEPRRDLAVLGGRLEMGRERAGDAFDGPVRQECVVW